MTKVETLADNLVALNVTELQELKKVLKDKYGLEETIPVAVAPVAVIEKPKIVEKSHVSIVLTKVSGVTSEKLAAVKVINKLTNAGLQGSMAFTKELPSILADNVARLDAETFKTDLAALNCEVELK